MATDGQLQLKIRDGQHQTCGERSGFVWKCWVNIPNEPFFIGIMISKTIGYNGVHYFQTSKIFHSLLRNAMIPSFFFARLTSMSSSSHRDEKRWKARRVSRPIRAAVLVSWFVVPGSVSSWKNPKVVRSLMKAPTEAPGMDFLDRPDQHQRHVNMLWVFSLCYFWIITYHKVIRFVLSGYLT